MYKRNINLDEALSESLFLKIALEVKASSNIQRHHLKGLRAVHEDFPGLDRIMVSLDKRERITDDYIRIVPRKVFLTKLWEGNLI